MKKSVTLAWFAAADSGMMIWRSTRRNACSVVVQARNISTAFALGDFK
jgi:hypothetical protein